jgi:hypothetical protein
VSGGTSFFADSAIGFNKPVQVKNFSLSGDSAGNYRLLSDVGTSYASIIEPNHNPIIPPGGGVIGDNLGNTGTPFNPGSGKNVGADIDAKSLNSSSIGVIIGTSVADPGISTAFQGSSVTNVSPEAANQSYQQGDQSAAELASQVLGFADLGAQLATTPARLQMAMQDATDRIRRLPSPSGVLR